MKTEDWAKLKEFKKKFKGRYCYVDKRHLGGQITHETMGFPSRKAYKRALKIASKK